jgi:hypothetical protein
MSPFRKIVEGDPQDTEMAQENRRPATTDRHRKDPDSRRRSK